MTRPGTLIGFFIISGCLLLPSAASATDSSSPAASYVERGKSFYKVKDYASAIKTWSKVLDQDPMNQEVLSLIEDARFQVDYQVAVLDSLEKEERIKVANSSELTKIAAEMTELIEKAKTKIEERKQKAASALLSKEEVRRFETDRQAAIQEIFKNGSKLYEEGQYDQAFEEWEKIAPSLPEEYQLQEKIRSLKVLIEEQKAAEKALAQESLAPAPATIIPAEPKASFFGKIDGWIKATTKKSKPQAAEPVLASSPEPMSSSKSALTQTPSKKSSPLKQMEIEEIPTETPTVKKVTALKKIKASSQKLLTSS